MAIHTLRLPYYTPAGVPPACLPRLEHLEIALAWSCEGLGALLCAVPQLKTLSVTICDEASQMQDELFVELGHAAPQLPNLTALGVHVQGDDAEEWELIPVTTIVVALLCDSLRCFPNLRRLYCNLDITPECLPMYFTVIATLKHLEILHIALDNFPLDSVLLADLRRSLHPSASLAVLSLKTTGILAFPIRPTFKDFHGHFQHLSFLQLGVNEMYTEMLETDVVRDVVHEARSLQLMGFNGNFYYVEHRDGVGVALDRWSIQRVHLRGVEDCGCEGWNWLMRQCPAL